MPKWNLFKFILARWEWNLLQNILALYSNFLWVHLYPNHFDISDFHFFFQISFCDDTALLLLLRSLSIYFDITLKMDSQKNVGDKEEPVSWPIFLDIIDIVLVCRRYCWEIWKENLLFLSWHKKCQRWMCN